MKKFIIINLCALSLMAVSTAVYSWFNPYQGCQDLVFNTEQETWDYANSTYHYAKFNDVRQFYACYYGPAEKHNGKYYVSSLQNRPALFTCPEGLWFCEEFEVCNWPFDPACSYVAAEFTEW